MMPAALGTGILLLVIGIWGILMGRNLFKTIICLSLMEGGVLVLLIASGFVPGGVPPIEPILDGPAVNPIPQAFAVTAIVIGAGNTALGLAFLAAWHHAGGSLDPDGETGGAEL
jgi:multicomponent Na+:H+ antiporter subunit C